MSIPLDRLYHYIESVAQDVYGDTIIYHFYPHGSKKIEDLGDLRKYSITEKSLQPELICYDQEPLNYAVYKDLPPRNFPYGHLIDPPIANLRVGLQNIYDQCLLLHSEKNSAEVKKYQNNGFIPVYYWNHAIVARDWFRYAKHCRVKSSSQTQLFLIYNRAWSGTREYRLKFLDLLIDYKIDSYCKTSFNVVDPETNCKYAQHNFLNKQLQVTNKLENYFSPTFAHSSASADFNIFDYNSTDIEVVLETLFDDHRIYLTEKILRPIAVGCPFIVASTPGVLKYLRDYGFKTFDTVFDESYDNIQDPLERLQSIVKLMKHISQWNDDQRTKKLKDMQEIVNFNKSHFFSSNFFNQIETELKINLYAGFVELENTNTSKKYIDRRKTWGKIDGFRPILTTSNSERSVTDTMKVLSKARKYYNLYLKNINK